MGKEVSEDGSKEFSDHFYLLLYISVYLYVTNIYV